MKLRDYQVESMKQILESFKTKKRGLLVLPTGAGKTFTFCHIVKEMGMKTLIVAHTKEILDQISKTLEVLGIPESMVIISSIQKISRRSELPDADLIIIDECHRAASATYQKIINGYKDKYILGATATAFRTDEKSVLKIFGLPTAIVNLTDLIENGTLCDIEARSIKTSISLKGIKTQSGDFNTHYLSNVINVANRNYLIAESYKKYADGKKTLCFVADLKHAYALMEKFKERGYSAEVIHGMLTKERRKDIILRFKRREIHILLNCRILTEGFDDPDIECILMARPTKSKLLYIQMIGRGLRKKENKESCLVLEFTDNYFDLCDFVEIFNLNAYQLKDKEYIPSMRSVIKMPVVKEESKEIGVGVVDEEIKLYVNPSLKKAPSFLLRLLDYYQIPYSSNISEYEANLLLAKRMEERYG